MSWTYRADQELPPFAVEWTDYRREIIDFSDVTYTFEARLVNRAGTSVVTKTSGIVGSASNPNVVVNWDPGELDIRPGKYRLHLRATSQGDDRFFRPGSEPVVTILRKLA